MVKPRANSRCDIQLTMDVADGSADGESAINKAKLQEMFTRYANETCGIENCISTTDLIVQLAITKGKIYLVDVRDEEEKKISRIPGSISESEFSAIWDRSEVSPTDLIVPYCTIGYRSGLFTQKMMRLGAENVRNGEGILLWIHQGERVVDSSGDESKTIHVFGEKWNLPPKGYSTVQKGFLGSVLAGINIFASKYS